MNRPNRILGIALLVLFGATVAFADECVSDSGSGGAEFSSEGCTVGETSSGGTSTTQFKPYRDAKRQSGSQSERPTYTIAADSTILVGGYQQYDLKNHQVAAIHSYKEKFEWIRQKLTNLHERRHVSTFMDIGCSAGLTSLLAHDVGYTTIYSLDHDSEYIELLNKIVSLGNRTSSIHPQTFSFGAEFPYKADVVFVGALIHWVFTCTADFGRFDRIMDYIKTAANEVIIIEWVDPNDPAIKSFHHTECGATSQEPYDVDGFERALRRVGTIQNRWELPERRTRVMYTVYLE